MPHTEETLIILPQCCATMNFAASRAQIMAERYALKEPPVVIRNVSYLPEKERLKTEEYISISFTNSLGKVCNTFVKFLVFGMGIVMIAQGNLTYGLVYAAYSFTNQLVSPMHSLIGEINAMQSVNGIVKRIKKISRESKKESQEKYISNQNDNYNIQMNDICLYRNGDSILQGISLQFEFGKKYLIIGENGSGKSTLLKLLKKSDNNYSGSISLGDNNINEYTYQQLGKSISYINEQVSLFCDTVKNNITLFRDYSDEEINRIIKTVGLNVELERIIKDGELNVSSGESRRIELARALLNNVR